MGIDVFSVNDLEYNETSGNKKSAAYCLLRWTFNGVCHNTEDLLNSIALSLIFTRELVL